jgi:transposase-like protein
MSANLQDPRFTDETVAREALEAVVWPNGPTCPHCGNADASKIAKLETKSVRPGLHYCNECAKQFTATVGTVFERSKIPLTKWWLAMHLIGSSKKGISSHQLHRMLGISYKSTWFMMHRIREAMRIGGLAPMGGAGSVVEADETFTGRKENSTKRRGHGHKNAVLSLVERGGHVRSFHAYQIGFAAQPPFHVDGVGATDIIPIVKANVAKETAMMTDEGGHYFTLVRSFREPRKRFS